MSKKNDLPKKSLVDKIGDRCAAFARRPWFRILTMSVATVLVVMLIFFSAGWLFKDQTSFTVSIGTDKGAKGLISLSENEDFSSPTVRLDAGGLKSITNISVVDLPEKLESDGGVHNGANYLAYTFYLKNSGEAAADIRSDLDITSALKGADEAIRVRVYRNGIDTTYAKIAKDGNPEEGTTPFVDATKAFSTIEENVQPNEIIKYTFVVWLEGNDPECDDDIKGGNVKMSLTFSVDDAET